MERLPGFLQLGRRVGERIIITASSGELIVLSVVKVYGDTVRLGFQAPPEVQIDREEIHRAKQAQAKAAASPVRQAGGG